MGSLGYRVTKGGGDAIVARAGAEFGTEVVKAFAAAFNRMEMSCPPSSSAKRRATTLLFPAIRPTAAV